ncbi:hypothetical protein HYS47_04265 [Candidatus Woesearchaeota archaeon]|nr:hypothetical protein [Candidatus Woesearchaeota archaeon]
MTDETVRQTLQTSSRFAIDDIIDDAIRGYHWDARKQLRAVTKLLPAVDLAAALPNPLFGELQELPDITWVRIQGQGVESYGRTYATATSLRKYSSSALTRLSIEVHRALHEQQAVGRFQAVAIQEYNKDNGLPPDARVDGFQFSRRSGLSHFLRRDVPLAVQKRYTAKASKEQNPAPKKDDTPQLPTSFSDITQLLSSRKIMQRKESVGPGTRLVAASELVQRFGFKDCYDRLYCADDVNWVYVPPTGLYATVSSLLAYRQGHHSDFSRKLEREVLRNRDQCVTLLGVLQSEESTKRSDSPYLPRAYLFVINRSLSPIVV